MNQAELQQLFLKPLKFNTYRFCWHLSGKAE